MGSGCAAIMRSMHAHQRKLPGQHEGVGGEEGRHAEGEEQDEPC